jgi:two-component system OmpR family sensor kinase
MRLALVVIGVTVVGVGALAGRWGVRRSLRPLRQIEDTAAAIAAGDLTRRVPDAPAGTEVGRLSAALNTMLSQIEQAFAVRAASEERMRRFVADASHELRTPLATIRGYGELYRMGALTDPEDLPRTMRRIEDSATRMGTLVQDLLHLARLGEGRPLAQDDVDLSVLVADAGADLRALDPTRPVRLVPLTDGGTTAGAITVGDESRLRQVLANLVGNVVQHTPAASPVELAVGREDGSAVLEVRDHGPGISPEHASRVFERFYRVDQARGRDSGGAGLGMAIVAAIVGAHQGHVQLGPTPGGGTTIRIALPAAPAPAPA